MKKIILRLITKRVSLNNNEPLVLGSSTKPELPKNALFGFISIGRKLTKLFRDAKLRRKIVWTYMLVCIIPILIVGIYAYNQSSRLTKQTQEIRMSDTLMQVAYSIDNQLSIYENLMNYVALNETVYHVINYPYQDFYGMYEKYSMFVDPLMMSMRYFHNDISKLTIFTDRTNDSLGEHVSPLLEIESEEWLKNFRDNSGIKWFTTEDNRIGCIGKMLKKLESDANSLLYMDVVFDSVFVPLQIMMEENNGAIVTDAFGNTIYTYNNFTDDYEEYSINNPRQITLKYAASSQRIKKAEWVLYFYKPLASFPTWSSNIMLTVGIVILVSFVVVFGIGLAASKLIVRPIELLTQNMQTFANDGTMEMAVNVTSDSRDEVGIMIHSFRKMVQRIRTLIDENYKKEISLRNSEMKALQAQINPHFLYNTLSMVNWKALQAGEQDISTIAIRLASFYRTTLNKGNSTTFVRDEIQNISDYLEIQLHMHDRSFDVVMDFANEILMYKMPNLILQPIVENAIHHGIDLKEDGRGELIIRGFNENGCMIITVTDNGVGIDEAACGNLLAYNARGYGVKNVNDRLKLLYGEDYGLNIKSVLGEGTVVTVRIPPQF